MRPPETGAVDLSRDAIAARQHAARETGRAGGYTGRELIDIAGRQLEEANRLRAIATRRSDNRLRRAQASRAADEHLIRAALQIRLAQATPLDRGYLHHLSLDRVQNVREEVAHAFADGPADLAVDTHRRIEEQRTRRRREGGTSR